MATILGGAALAATVIAGGTPAQAGSWAVNAANRNGMVTNEYAYWNPTSRNSLHSPYWLMNSGSLFSRKVAGGPAFWTGRPDNKAPDARSTNGTNSAVFRMITRNASFRNVTVGMSLNISGLTATSSTPAVAWDGVHLFLRYQSEESLYYATVARRDGAVVIKKKCRGGGSNGGTYYTLASTGGYRIPTNKWRFVQASAVTRGDGAVNLAVWVAGRRVSIATDNGIGCAAITKAGRTGVRGDNANFFFRSFRVRT
ncbi:hypothetical protein GCM10010201_01780 [Pilimelia columellifera subsp. columellifera]|uniref:Uncharacterized protein n=1 Tax=Pilimelia columellifera subsp. columellifera TaxID=706583 RepID=A0ABN3MY11_9ACTN